MGGMFEVMNVCFVIVRVVYLDNVGNVWEVYFMSGYIGREYNIVVKSFEYFCCFFMLRLGEFVVDSNGWDVQCFVVFVFLIKNIGKLDECSCVEVDDCFEWLGIGLIGSFEFLMNDFEESRENVIER